MARNGVGTYVLPSGQPVVTGTAISSTTHNSLMSDIANALSTSVATDGQTAMAANLPMGGFKLTGLGPAAMAGDGLRYENLSDIQNQTQLAFTSAGTATAYTLTPTPVITVYTAGQSFFVTFHLASGTSPTLTINGVATPPTLVKQNVDGSYSNIAAGDIPINHRSRVTLLSATQALVERLPVAAGGPAFSAYASSTQVVTSAVFTKVAINTKIFDTNSNFDNTTNFRFLPTVAGYYQVSGTVRGAVTAGAALITAIIYKNGTDYARGGEINATASISAFGATVSETVFFNGSTDYVELYGYVSGTSPVFSTSSVSNTSRFSAVLVRGV